MSSPRRSVSPMLLLVWSRRGSATRHWHLKFSSRGRRIRHPALTSATYGHPALTSPLWSSATPLLLLHPLPPCHAVSSPLGPTTDCPLPSLTRPVCGELGPPASPHPAAPAFSELLRSGSAPGAGCF